MLEFTLPALSCGHGVRSITEAVQATDPAATVQADLGGHRVRVETSAPCDEVMARRVSAGDPPVASAACGR